LYKDKAKPISIIKKPQYISQTIGYFINLRFIEGGVGLSTFIRIVFSFGNTLEKYISMFFSLIVEGILKA
jgi:hypothetical protein